MTRTYPKPLKPVLYLLLLFLVFSGLYFTAGICPRYAAAPLEQLARREGDKPDGRCCYLHLGALNGGCRVYLVAELAGLRLISNL